MVLEKVTFPSVPPLSVVIVIVVFSAITAGPVILTPGVSSASPVVISPFKVIPPPAVAVKVLISLSIAAIEITPPPLAV